MESGPLQYRVARNPLDFFFRYDFFVSYRWSDGRTYAVRLRDELKQRGFVVFLDSSDYAKGDNWREEGRRALARSSRLLLVVSPDVFESEPVRREVEIFAGLGRRILPIDIAGTLATADRSEPLLQLLPPEVLRFAEPKRECLETGPSAEVVDDIVRSFELIHQHARRLRILIAIIIVLACSVVAAAIAGVYAETKRRQAIAESEARELQRLVAEGGHASATLDDRAEWSTGLAIAASNAFAARNAHREVPRGLHLALLRGVWAATPYRVLSRNLSPSAQAHFVGDGRVVAITEERQIELIDPGSGTATVLPLADEPPGARRVAFSADGRKVLVLGQTVSVRVWRTDGTPVRAIEAPDDVLAAAVFLGNDRALTASRAGVVRSWSLTDASDGTVAWSVPDGIVAMAVSPLGDRIAIADDGAPAPGLRIHDLATGSDVSLVHKEAPSRTVSVAFSPDGARLVSSDELGEVRLWDTRTGERISGVHPSGEPVSDVAFSADGHTIAMACFDKSVHVWETERGHERAFYGHLGPVSAVGFSPDGKHVLSASEDGSIRLWDIYSHPGVVVLDGRMDSLCGQAATSSGDRIAIIGRDGQVGILDALTGEKVRDLGEHGTTMQSASFSPDGTRVVAAPERMGPVVWDAATGARVSTLDGVHGVRSVAFAHTADRVMFVGTNGVAGVWNVGGGVRALDVPPRNSVYAMGMSFDGLRIATAGQGGGVQVWNAGDGTIIAQLGGNSIFGNTTCFARDPDRLLTGGGDGIAYLWDVRHRTRLLTLAGHDDSVNTATFSLDERLIYTTSDDHSVRIWDAGNGEQVGRLVLPGLVRDAIELPGERLAVSIVSTGGETWTGSTKLNDLLAAACSVLMNLSRVDRVPAASLTQLHHDCATLVPRRL
jgi:WD40 repeat protein